MSEKMWGAEPFWGLGYDWDPDWVLTDRQKELRTTLIDAVRAGDAREREALRRRAALSPPQPRAARRARLPRADGARGVRRPRREPRRLRDDLRDDRALRLRVDGDVLRHAHGRRAGDHAPPHARADRQVHPPAQLGPDRHALLLRPRDRLALLVPGLVARRAAERRLQDQQEGVVDDLRRLRRLLRPADDEPGLQGLRRPLGLRRRQGALRGAAVPLGRARPPRQPVRRDLVHRRRDPRRAARRAGGRRRHLERRGRRPLVPDRLLVGVERARARRDRHREAAHDAQAPRRRRHARGRLPDDPGLRRPGGDGDERRAALRLLRRPGVRRRDREQHDHARAGRAGARQLPPLGLADQVRRGAERRARTSTRCCTRAAARATSATWSSSATSATRRPAG